MLLKRNICYIGKHALLNRKIGQLVLPLAMALSKYGEETPD